MFCNGVEIAEILAVMPPAAPGMLPVEATEAAEDSGGWDRFTPKMEQISKNV